MGSVWVWGCLGIIVLATVLFGLWKMVSVFVDRRISDYQSDLIRKHC